MQLPIVKQISAKLLGDDLISVRPNESWAQSLQRHLLNERKKKIEQIHKSIKNKKIVD